MTEQTTKPDDRQRGRHLRDLPVSLTKEERLNKYQEAHGRNREADKIESERLARMAADRKRMVELRNEGKQLSEVAGTGIEYRPVWCYERSLPDHKAVSIIREDTGEEVLRRSMTPSELQVAFPFLGPGAVTAPGKPTSEEDEDSEDDEDEAAEDPPEHEYNRELDLERTDHLHA